MSLSHRRLTAAFLAKPDCSFIDQIFNESARVRLAQSAELLPELLTPTNFDRYQDQAREMEILFTTWGFPSELAFDPDKFPRLRVLFFAGGSTKSFARPLLERDIQVVSARAANAISVAHFCLGQIILSAKGYFRNTRESRTPGGPVWSGEAAGAGLYKETVALLGMGAVARELAGLLRPFSLKILAVDPYLKEADAKELGVTLATMEEAFAQGYVVSNHLPDLPSLSGVLDGRLFASMRPQATFINTGRGAQVNEAELIEVFQQRPDLTALLDVTMPEPPVADSPLYRLPNIQLSRHIAGSLNNELARMGDFLITEFEQYIEGHPLIHADTLEMLDRLA